MVKPRKQTYTLEMYLKKVRDLDIRSDQDVQRMSGQWNNSMASELVVSVLNGEYVPPIILGMEQNSQSWIIDGLQRSTTLMMFRFGNLKISPNIEEPVVEYKAKVRDADGNIMIDGNGDLVWEEREFDIRRKTYDRMPEELKKIFNEYQIETVIHENYDMQQISRLVRRFNFNKPMNVSQRAFTFCDKYARRIREILKHKFFIECTGYTKNERKNGVLERTIMESVMCMFHLDSWKKSNQIGTYLNENASMEEFDIFENNIARLENIITENMYSLFTSRDSFILFTLFHKFTGLNLNDGRFEDFMSYFKETTDGIDLNEFYDVDKNCSTKDKNVILKKLNKLETLMHEYLGIPAMETESESGAETDSEMKSVSMLEFVRENVASYVTDEDIELYKEVLETLSRKLDASNVLLEDENMPSFVALVAYSFKCDVDLDDWFLDFAERNNTYITDQKKNYTFMVDDLKDFMGHAHAA